MKDNHLADIRLSEHLEMCVYECEDEFYVDIRNSETGEVLQSETIKKNSAVLKMEGVK